MPRKKTRTKLTRKEQKLASRYIAEEIRTKQYPHKQAIAIGLSRARTGVKKARRRQTIARIMARYHG